MSAVLRAEGLGKRFRRRWALTDCSLDVPAGRVTDQLVPLLEPGSDAMKTSPKRSIFKCWRESLPLATLRSFSE